MNSKDYVMVRQVNCVIYMINVYGKLMEDSAMEVKAWIGCYTERERAVK
jgi:hypothetical protein